MKIYFSLFLVIVGICLLLGNGVQAQTNPQDPYGNQPWWTESQLPKKLPMFLWVRPPFSILPKLIQIFEIRRPKDGGVEIWGVVRGTRAVTCFVPSSREESERMVNLNQYLQQFRGEPIPESIFSSYASALGGEKNCSF